MRNKRARWAEHGKSMLILLLSLSAVYLLTRTSLTGTPGGWLQSLASLLPSAVEPTSGPTEGRGGLVRPVRITVSSGAAGRFGVQYDQGTVDTRFGGGLLNLFSDALTGAGESRAVNAEAWQRALASAEYPVIYLDLMGSVPAEGLPSWLGGRSGSAPLTGRVRRLFLTSDRTGAALLYYSNETDGSYYACGTSPDLTARLAAVSEEFTPNGARFAFEEQELYGPLSPYTLILPSAPRPPVYAASNPIPLYSELQSELVQALSFHSSNAVNLGDLVYREETDTLRVSSQGVVSYYSASAENPRYPVSGVGETAMVDTAWDLLELALGDLSGAGRPYLAAVLEEEGGTALYFGYQLNGSMVQLGTDGYAARFLVQDGRVSAFALQLRRYEVTAETSIVLPETQAVAAMAALGAEGSELVLCYQDQRLDRVEAGWVAR